ncbi:MAG: hypothetical protein Q7S53_03900 [bacterium]|nr:hypothetical protein [bacterium]
MCVPKPKEQVALRYTVTFNPDIPTELIQKIWAMVDAVEGRERELLGRRMRRFEILPDGNFHYLN